jgi:hypothetical protein
MGTHTKHGGYIINWKKVRDFVGPNLEGCEVCSGVVYRELDEDVLTRRRLAHLQLKPYVSLRAQPQGKSFTAKEYLSAAPRD